MSATPSRRDTSMQLADATWLLGLVAKRMVVAPDGTARVELPAAWVDRIREFIAEQAATP